MELDAHRSESPALWIQNEFIKIDPSNGMDGCFPHCVCIFPAYIHHPASDDRLLQYDDSDATMKTRRKCMVLIAAKSKEIVACRKRKQIVEPENDEEEQSNQQAGGQIKKRKKQFCCALYECWIAVVCARQLYWWDFRVRDSEAQTFLMKNYRTSKVERGRSRTKTAAVV